MKKFLKTMLLVALVPLALTSCDPGTEVKKDEYVQKAAEVEKAEPKTFKTIEANYEFSCKVSGYYKQVGEENESEKGQIVFTFSETGWESNKEADSDDVNDSIDQVLNAKASAFVAQMETQAKSSNANLKYYVNPLGLGFEGSATTTATGLTVETKASCRVIFNDYGYLSMFRTEVKMVSKGKIVQGTVTVDGNGEMNMRVQLDLVYKE